MGNLTGRITGKARELLGRATHNRRMETKGKIQRGVAEMEHRAKDMFDSE